MQREMEGSERPEGVPAKEIVVLHDPEGEVARHPLRERRRLSARRRGAERDARRRHSRRRASVTKYQVAFRMSD
jgi:hypothetical protein